MMNRALLQRQMFANGGAAVPNQFKGFSKLPEEVQMKMNPQLAQKYEEGGDVSKGFDPANPYNIAKFFRDNPGTTVSDYNSYFGTNLDPKEFGIFEKPKPMQEGGVAGLMSQPDMAAMPMGSTQEVVDPAMLESALQGASEEVGDLEQAGDFKSMMDQFSGEEKSEEERRDDLASIVGPEDAAQTPDSVLALVTPVVQISMMDQGIAPMAQEAMDTPVQGDMAGGIMSMTGAGNEPPVNFNQGGEVLRRGDEDPVQFFNLGGAASITPMTEYKQDVGKTAEALLPVFRQFMPKTDPEVAKQRLQSDILFDIANTALAFSAPMEGEKPGLSGFERAALAAQKTQLLPKIQQRTAKSAAEEKSQEAAIKGGALQSALAMETARLKEVAAERRASIQQLNENARKVADLNFKKAEGISERKHKENLAEQERILKRDIERLKGQNDLNSIKSRAIYEEALQKLKGQQKINELGIIQEDKLELINEEYAKKKGLQNVKDAAAMARLNKDLESKEGIASANNQTKKTIANNLNASRELIAANNLDFAKVQEENKLNQLSIENGQALLELDLKKAELKRKELKDYLDNQTDLKNIAIAKRRLEEVDIRIADIKEFSALTDAERKQKEFEFKKTQEQNLNIFRNEKLGIERRKNIIEDRKITLENNAKGLTKFGSSLDGRTLAFISDADKLKKYANGSLGTQDTNDINALVTAYISPKTIYNEQTKRFEQTTNKLPPEYIEAAKQRGALGLTIPNLTGYVDTKTDTPGEETGADDRLVVKDFMGTGQSVKLTDTSVPKLPIDTEKTGATGSGDYLANAVNLALETIGIGQPFKGTSRSKKQLDAINVDLVNVILGDRTGKSAKDERDEIRRILPDINKFIGGDETAAGKVAQVINFIDRKLETEITGLNQLVLSKGDFTNSASKVLRLKQLKAGYQQFLDAYNLQRRGGGDKPPLSSFRKSN